MTKVITIKQRKVLELIYGSVVDNGFPPTMAELKQAIDVSSNQAVLNYINSLEKKGLIDRREGQARSIRILPLGFKVLGIENVVPIAGNSSCGPFVETIEEVGDWITLPGHLTEVKESRDKLFVIQVYGDSMINANINNGDLLLIKDIKEFKSGDIVVARNDDGTTVKRFIADDKRSYLKSENPSYPEVPIYQETYFDGKVIANLSTLKRANI